ncbi:MAG: acyl-CoA dehydrogenase [Gemmatimonadaceae bacterium]|nr:acyl-CoA dehydrogenase [Gemmatimonadaceae bacterium]
MSDEFYQDAPSLGNQFETDVLLRAYLEWRLPPAIRDQVTPELFHLGERAVTELLALGDAAEAEPPRHVPYDPWGRRVDRIEVSDAWRALDRISAETGLVATAFERRHGAWSRVHQMAMLYLFHPSSATYSCPLAMTDGAARFLELHGDARTREAFDRLTSRDPSRFWTSGQWMTERTGGSDVSGTSTVARLDESGNTYRLYGTKWFTSATTSQMAITLARIEGAPAGGRGLSAFFVQLRDGDGALRGIRVNRLKDKLGTRALPTAELTLDGTPALLVGGAGDGVRKIASLFNVTRVYNAVAAVSGMRRALALAHDYAARRQAFGKRLADHPLHAETLAGLDARFHAAFQLTFQVVELLGREETGDATDAELAMLRLLTPVAKLFTAKQAVLVASEVMESFGGAGYIEDTRIPRLLRDAQVLPIWEGTTNVLSLDVWRAIERTDALAPWLEHVRAEMAGVRHPSCAIAAFAVRSAAELIGAYVRRTTEPTQRELGARRLAFAIARTAAASRLVAHAEWEAARSAADPESTAPAVERMSRWLARDLAAGLDVVAP